MSECKKCGGLGYTQTDNGHMGMPQAVQCDCVIDKAIDEQAERAWTHLSVAPIRKRSMLNGKISKNLVITATTDQLRLHLRSALGNVRNPNLFVKVIGDHTLMSAWLGSMMIQGKDIADPDFQRDLKVYSLDDLAEAPYLMVIRLGTKVARNAAMSEVVTETIEIREHLKKPTWLIIDPDKPLEEGHIAWSRLLEDTIHPWDRINLNEKTSSSRSPSRSTKKSVSNMGSHKRVKL
jgi:hypothetical protein